MLATDKQLWVAGSPGIPIQGDAPYAVYYIGLDIHKKTTSYWPSDERETFERHIYAGKTFRAFNIIDDYNRKCLTVTFKLFKREPVGPCGGYAVLLAKHFFNHCNQLFRLKRLNNPPRGASRLTF